MTEETFSSFMESFEEFQKNTKVEGEIEFPIEVSSIDSRVEKPRAHHGTEVGGWVSIRPVRVEETYLGIYLGDFTFSVFHSYNIKTKVVSILPHNNPAIYVPDLKRVVWGCESWWGPLKNEKDLRQITDADIQNIWYVKALKDLLAKEPEEHIDV